MQFYVIIREKLKSIDFKINPFSFLQNMPYDCIMKEINLQNIVDLLSQNIRQIVKEELENITKNFNTVSDEEVIYDIEQTAQMLGISKSTLYTLNRNREIEYYKKVGKCFYTKKNILEFIKSGNMKTKKEIEFEALNTPLKVKNKK